MLPSSPQRVLTPYERTQLARYGHTIPLENIGEQPIEYVTGKIEFDQLVLSISPDALIPRMETEELVRLATEELAQRETADASDQSLTIADIGTGCGAVIVSLAHHLAAAHPNWRWLGSDCEAPAVALAKRNEHKILSKEIIEWYVGDLLAPLPSNSRFDLLIANLPYIPTQRIPFLDASVNQYEPIVALDGGPQGLTLINRLLESASDRLNPSGVILLEIDYTHTPADFAQFADRYHIQVITDSNTRNRFARLSRFRSFKSTV